MPNKPRKPCNKAGCGNLTRDRYCDEHKNEPNRYRESPNKKGYGYRWAQYSRRFRQRNPLCVECLKVGKVTTSEHTDHINPVTGPDDPGFWDPNNHQALCASCHSRKTVKEDGGFGNAKRKR